MGDAKLVCFGTLLGQLLIGFLDQSPLMRERRPHTTFMTNEK
jgi:hypothetical protein